MKLLPSLFVISLISQTVYCKVENFENAIADSRDSTTYLKKGYGYGSLVYPTKDKSFSKGTGGKGWGWRGNTRQDDSTFWQTGPFNFVNSIPKALELIGLGCLWIRALGVGTGFPFVYIVLLPLLLLIAVFVVFIPNEELNFINLIRDIEASILG